jgi:hypothetical protein
MAAFTEFFSEKPIDPGLKKIPETLEKRSTKRKIDRCRQVDFEA